MMRMLAKAISTFGNILKALLGIQRSVFVLLLAIHLSGCAHEMALEDAKKVSLTMMDSGFQAPPRKINDILKDIDQHRSSPATLKEYINSAEQQPTGNDPVYLSSFLRKRASAALLIGRESQAADDYRKLLNYKQNTVIYNLLASTEFESGNYSAAIQAIKQATKYGEGLYKPWCGSLIRETSSEIHLAIGDYAKAYYEAKFPVECHQQLGINHKDPPPDYMFSSLYAASYEAENNWVEAEKERRNSIEQLKLEKFSDKYSRLLVTIKQRLRLIRNLMRQGKFVETEIDARELLLFINNSIGVNNIYSAKCVNLLAEIYFIQGRFKDSGKLAGKCIAMLATIQAPAKSPELLAAYFIIGKSLLLDNDWNGALKAFSNIISENDDSNNIYLSNYYNDVNIGIVLIKSGKAKEAEKLFHKKYVALDNQLGESHYDTVETKALKALALSAQGKNKESLAILREAYPVLISSIGNKETNKEAERAFRLKLITETYLDLLFENSINGDIPEDLLSEAFRITEAARAGTIQKAIADLTLRNFAGTDKDLGELIRQYQDIQVQIEISSDLLSKLLWSTQDATLAETINNLKTKVKTLNSASTSMLKEIRKRIPSYDQLINPAIITVDDVRKSLRQDEVLISVYPTATRTYVWVVPNKGNPQLFKSSLTENEIDKIVSNLRKSLDANLKLLGDLPPFDLVAAYNLYEKLFKPTEPLRRNSKSLIYISNGSLGQLPLYVLPTTPHKLSPENGLLFSNYREVPWLIKEIAVTTAPSLDSFRKIRSAALNNIATRKPYIGFGDPIFSTEQLVQKENVKVASRSINIRGLRITNKGNLDNDEIISSQFTSLTRLPDTADEIQKVAGILGADLLKDVFLGVNASKETVLTTNLSDRKVVAFATHALIPGDLDGLDQPALALSSPTVTGKKGNGLLTMKEILKLKLNADLVVLSACNTGAADGKGREAVSGLGRAFFFAGTKSILVSMWPVETTSAMKLVTQFFSFHKNNRLPRTEALRKSMISLIENENIIDNSTNSKITSYGHPLFWAPFVLAGDGSGTFD
jgi:CHAT domain-containing protein